MRKTKTGNRPKYCPSCGAPVVAEICSYCGTATGLNTAQADMEYPVLECKAANMNFWTIGFPAIFAAAFGIPGLIVTILAAKGFGGMFLFGIGLPFLLIGVGAAVFMIRTISRYAKVKRNGKTIQAAVYGYMDDSVLINNRPAQIVKLLVETPDGPRFILYKLGNTLKPYGINDRIDLMVCEDCFMICKNREIAKW